MSPLSAAQTAPTYDEVPYESFSYAQTHPSHTRAIATLFGLNPSAVETARVLELGCASGGNLLPQALLYPKATFVGIDLSHEQIVQADANKKALKLSNVEFLQEDIFTYAPKEKFDYIICHGILSWVPEPVRQRVFKLCSEVLSPNGIAIISYNALPGWNAVRSLREMMLYHTSRFTKPEEKITQAKSLLGFLAENLTEGSGYRALVEEEKRLLDSVSSSYMYHDHLETDNTQFYLYDFVRQANASNLAYVGDANLSLMFLGNMPAKAAEKLQVIDDIVSQEQYMDFIANRRFRSSILCKNGQPISRALENDQILNYCLSFTGGQVQIEGGDPSKDIVFKTRAGNFTTHKETAGTLFMMLASYDGRPFPAHALIKEVAKKLGLSDPQPVRDVLVEQGINLLLRGFLQIHDNAPHYTSEISDKPVAFALARHECTFPSRGAVTNVLGMTLPADLLARTVLSALDGTRNMKEIAKIVVENVDKGVLNLEQDGKPITDAAQKQAAAEALVAELLKRFAKKALLVA